MRRAAAAAIFLAAACVGAADAKPTCVAIHARGHDALDHRVADAVRARLARSHSFVVGDGHGERSLHITVRYGAMRMPKGVPQLAHDPSDVNVSFEYRTPGAKPPLDFEGSVTIGMQCGGHEMAWCVNHIIKTAYVTRHIDGSVWESGLPPPTCMYEFDQNCTSSAR